MSKKKLEMAFCTALKKAFKQEGHFFYKIPDSSSAQRFLNSKPYDITACVDGKSWAIEAKALPKFEAFGLRHLRDCQIEGLSKHANAGGRSFVALEVHAGRGDYRAYFFEWDDFKQQCKGGSIKANELKELSYIQRDKKGNYDLVEFFNQTLNSSTSNLRVEFP